MLCVACCVKDRHKSVIIINTTIIRHKSVITQLLFNTYNYKFINKGGGG